MTLTADESATIYYTTDGSTPNTLSAVYSAPISISDNTRITSYNVCYTKLLRDLRAGFFKALNDTEILLPRIPAIHLVQNRIRTALHRKMQVPAQFLQRAETADQFVGEVFRMRGGETDSLDLV